MYNGTRTVMGMAWAAVTLLAIPAGAQEVSPANGDGLVVDYPVFPPVEPPRGYAAAIDAGTRTERGRPGPSYWQQRVDYDIDVRLEPESARLTGSETIILRNQTPRQRRAIVLRLYQNVFGEGAPRNRTVELTGGMTVDRIAVGGMDLGELPPVRFFGQRQRGEEPGYRIQSTLAVISLPEPLEPQGTLDIEVDWSFTVSGGGGFRTGHLNHEIFDVAQWYPQVAVFDDVFGQDLSPYLGSGEFYDDYGDFHVEVTVPEGWLVVGTGTLMNPQDVLLPEAASRLAAAAEQDTVVPVVSAEDRKAGRATAVSADGWLTWTFEAADVRDFAFAAGDTYVWHATGADTNGGAHARALIQNLFDPRVEHWAEATLYAQHAIEFFSDYILPYPYPQATTAMGPPQVQGMEYPMITFINQSEPGRPLNGVVTHELSHFWMPMIVGTKEMAYAWMDEGLTTYNTSLATADYYGGDVETPGDNREYRMVVQLEMQEPSMGHMDYAEHFFGAQVGAYAKPGMLMHTLRHMIGADTFDAAYRDYAATWAFKHPMPWDFFALMETAAGEDLDWFWQPWFYGTATLDQSLEAVQASTSGIDVTVSNRSTGVMPVELFLEYADGSSETVIWPASVWAGTRTVQRAVPTRGEVRKVTLDPDGYYPDLDRSNNRWDAADD